MENVQRGPWPTELEALVVQLRYRPGWTFSLADIDRGQGCSGLTLDIVTCGFNSYHPDQGETYRVHHYRPVPAAAFNRASWLRWLFDQLLDVEKHETMEFFALETGDRDPTDPTARNYERPFAPTHGPGDDPYVVHEYGGDEQRRTSFRGVVKA